LGGCVRAPAGAQFEDAINGLRSMDGTKGSWELPLQPHNGGIEPDWTWAGDEQAARREAVERISANHEAIVKFSARGAGSKGMPRYGAALSDPNAISNEAVQTAVDKVLRTGCLALLEGTDKLDVSMSEMATVIVKEGGEVYSGGVVASLAYLRDRIGVPRDMRLPAAQQLRAHLNWAIGKILDATE
jgi:glutathione S-transferase